MLQENKLQICMEDLYILNSLKCLNGQYSNETIFCFDIDVMFKKAKEFGLIHCVFEYYKKSEFIQNTESPFFIYNQLADECFSLLKNIWSEVSFVLEEAKICPIVCKGFHLLNTVYNEKSKYLINDIDILIKKDQSTIVKKIMNNIGYSQNILNTNESTIIFVENFTISEFEKKHYELFPFTKIIEVPQLKSYIDFIEKYLKGHPFIIENDKIYFAIEFDIHHNLSHGIDVEDILKDDNKFKVNHTDSNALSYDTLAWFLPARLYHEVMVFNKMKLKMLSDLAGIVTSESLNYDFILEISDKYSLQPSLLYVYNYLHYIIGIPIPKNFLDYLNKKKDIKSSYRDWGDFVPKILNTRIITTGFITSSQKTIL